jgi:hypothetical protein
MNEHLKNTVTAIDASILEAEARVEKLRKIRQDLTELFGAPETIAIKRATSPRPSPPKVEREKNPASSNSAIARHFSQQPSAETIALMAVARKMPEPINAATLSIAGGANNKFATNSIMRWAAKGWLEKLSPGNYRRSKTFPMPN